MKNYKLISGWTILVGLGLFTLLIVFSTNSLSAGNSSDIKVIKIYKSKTEKGDLVLDPPVIYVNKGTVIIWTNGIDGKEEVQVVFADGKRCKVVSFSPAQNGFSLDAKACYATIFMPYASTSSLKFLDIGTFEYSVATQDEKKKVKGKIIVRDL